MKTLIARLKRRWIIMKALAGEASQIEQAMPYAHLVGIGFNTVWWAAIEHQLDILVHWHAVTRLGDDRKDHPRALTNKLDYLKKVEKDLSLGEAERSLVRSIRLRLTEMAELRHDFTHSFAPIGNPHDPWSATRFRYDGKNLQAITKKFQIEDIQLLTNDIAAEIGRISPLVQRLCEDWLIANRSRLNPADSEFQSPGTLLR